MPIKLLPASVNTVDGSQALIRTPDGSTTLAPLIQGALTARAQNSLILSTDAFAWSSSTRRDEAKFISGTPVEDSNSGEMGHSAWQYVSGWAWSRLVESMPIALYLSYASGSASWSGQLIDLYA